MYVFEGTSYRTLIDSVIFVGVDNKNIPEKMRLSLPEQRNDTMSMLISPISFYKIISLLKDHPVKTIKDRTALMVGLGWNNDVIERFMPFNPAIAPYDAVRIVLFGLKSISLPAFLHELSPASIKGRMYLEVPIDNLLRVIPSK